MNGSLKEAHSLLLFWGNNSSFPPPLCGKAHCVSLFHPSYYNKQKLVAITVYGVPVKISDAMSLPPYRLGS